MKTTLWFSMAAVCLGLTSTSALALSGQFMNKNTTGISTKYYRFEDHPRRVFVIHHFGVEVC